MDPKAYRLESPDQIHGFFKGYRCHPPTGWWFRGQADASWALLPKGGRNEYLLKDGKSLGRFYSWSKRAVAYDPTLPENDWERLAVAQHFGLATCLLDWTQNPLVATYFCCAELPDRDGAVYCYDPELFVDEKSLELSDEIECNGVGFMPRSISSRILNQRGVFTVHMPSSRELEVKPSQVFNDHPNLAKLIIPKGLKVDLLSLLNDYGINHSVLFPDLEGLSEYVNWETRNISVRRTRQ